MRDDCQRLLDIRDAIERIQRYTASGRRQFDSDELVQTWVLRHLQIIGEAARGLTQECKAQQPQVPWEKINGMRNVLVHHYFGIDTEIVWVAVEKDLPPLKQAVNELIRRHNAPGKADA